MGILRIIWGDILWVNSRLHVALKVLLLIIVVALCLKLWSLGIDYWLELVPDGKWKWRKCTRLELWGVPLAFILSGYFILVIDRYRKQR